MADRNAGSSFGPSAPRPASCSRLADGPDQQARVGDQTGGRVGFFLRVGDFDAIYRRMELADVTFVGPVRDEPYGRVVVFEDLCGNRWDLLGPLPA